MRSSIACARCRRSKVKCINNGVNTPCRACETTGRECTYPPPAVLGGGGLKREGSLSGNAGPVGAASGETFKRHRPRKSATSVPSTTATKNSIRGDIDPLDTAVLTPKVWAELFEIYQLHFSTDLPFLHAPTFLKPLRQSALHPPGYGALGGDSQGSTPLPPISPILLLAFLTLTSRFHPQLVLHHSPPTSSRPSQPLVAAEYYYNATRARLESMYGDHVDLCDLEPTQALLMLALHNWGMCRGVRAWIAVGVAIRSAQVLGLQFERDPEDAPPARSLALSAEAEHMGIAQKLGTSSFDKGGAFIEQEIRRRTFWSCFAMDRYLSSGKHRPQMLNVKDLRVQLPSSERAFLFGEKVRTLHLGEELDHVAGRTDTQNQSRTSAVPDAIMSDGRDDEANGRWEVGADEGALSRYLKILDLYGRIVKWSCAGGRRREQYPPWDEHSTFYELQRSLNAFNASLPRNLTLSSANTSAHISQRSSTPYSLMHMVRLLCSIILHREYVPFIPLRCSKPQGPLDPPLFPAEKYQVPAGFWEESARELFGAARNLTDLARTCHDWGVLVETPIAGFAIYTVAFVGVYAINFPWMDPDGYMCKRNPAASARAGEATADDDGSGADAARKALELVGHMRPRLQMADGWFRTIRRCHTYFVRIKKDFRRNAKALAESDGASAESYRQLTLREGGAGGGLEEYKLLERILQEFGNLQDENLNMPDATDEDTAEPTRSMYEGSEEGSAAMRSGSMDLHEAGPDTAGLRPERWNAINTVAAAARANAPGLTSSASTPHSQPSLPQSGDRYRYQQAGAPYSTSPAGSRSTPATGASYEPPIYSQLRQAAQNPAQRASLSLQQQLHHPPQLPPPQPPTSAPPGWASEKENWLNNLDTRFGGDDIAAFVAGNNWEDWASNAASTRGVGGWLSAVWGGAAAAPAAAGGG